MPQYTAKYVTTMDLLDYPPEHQYFEDGLPNGERVNIKDLEWVGIITIKDEHTSLSMCRIPNHKYQFEAPSIQEAAQIAEDRRKSIQSFFPDYRDPCTTLSLVSN